MADAGRCPDCRPVPLIDNTDCPCSCCGECACHDAPQPAPRLRDESTPEGRKIWADVEKAAANLPEGVLGTYVCRLCGKDEPHRHEQPALCRMCGKPLDAEHGSEESRHCCCASGLDCYLHDEVLAKKPAPSGEPAGFEADHDWRRQMEAYGYDSVSAVGKMLGAARREGRREARREDAEHLRAAFSAKEHGWQLADIVAKEFDERRSREGD